MEQETSKKPFKRIIITLVILLVAAAVIIGAWRITTKKTTPIEDPTAVYNTAISLIDNNSTMYYLVNSTKSFSIQYANIEEKLCQYITVENPETDDMRVYIDESLTIGSHYIQSINTFYDNMEYLTIQGVDFKSPTTAEEYTKKYSPYVLLDAALYGNITGFTNDEGAEITFTDASAVESWASLDGMEFISASGTAYLDSNGNLTKTKYDLEYYVQTYYFHVTYDVVALQTEAPSITEPDASVYQEINLIDAPLMIEKTCGYLSATNYVYADYDDLISCQAFGDERIQIIALEMNAVQDWKANIETTLATSNTSKSGVGNATVTVDIYEDGVYTQAIDGKNTITSSDYDQMTIENHCQNIMIGTIILPQYISSVKITKDEEFDYTFLEFTATEAFAELLAAEACTTLYQSPDVLNEMAESYQTNRITCYMTLDSTTGFPYASGFYYSGTHTISGIPYELLFTADQEYDYVSSYIDTSDPDKTEETEDPDEQEVTE
ncbi:MAG: hypothetical protein J6Q54_09045 [Oscillospiraceae bacterium]|nr:hypothetical protein [Oscillospiraceae bacterium]